MSNIDNIEPPHIKDEVGSLHPINQVKDFLLNMLADLGFQEVDGPEIESEEFNFDMLNIKKSHPARQMHDTFYVENKSHVLRTHTSPVQIRSMLKVTHHWHLLLLGKSIEKTTMLLTYPCFIRLKVYMLTQM